jgi:hypothetical protein
MMVSYSVVFLAAVGQAGRQGAGARGRAGQVGGLSASSVTRLTLSGWCVAM